MVWVVYMEEKEIKIGTILEGAIKDEEYSYQMYMKAREMTTNEKIREMLSRLAAWVWFPSKVSKARRISVSSISSRVGICSEA